MRDSLSPFQRAVSMAEDILAPGVPLGLFTGKVHAPTSQDEYLYRLKINFWHMGDVDVPMIVSEDQAAQLLEAASESRGAFDLLGSVAASYIFHGWTLPESVMEYSVRVLGQTLEAPKRKRTDRTFARKFFIYATVRIISQKYGLKETRNDEGGELSGCDAVQLALEKCGYRMTTRAVKDIMVGSHNNEKEFRRDADALLAEMVEYWRRNSALVGLKGGWNNCQSALKFDPLSASNIDPLGGEQARRCVALT